MSVQKSVLIRAIILVLAGTPLSLATAQPGGTFELTRFVMAGGGGVSSGGVVTLTGTVGQPQAGTMSGGRFSLGGGFWLGGDSGPVDVPEGLPITPNSSLVFRVHLPSPMPFRSFTTIAYDLPSTTAVRMALYNLRGELVAILVDDRMSAGKHVARWDGKNREGRRVASGVYILMTEAGDWSSHQKLTLLE